MQDLSLRLTHGYVGTYKHLDQWLRLGTHDEIASRPLPLTEAEQNDHCEIRRDEVFVLVSIDQQEADFFNRWINSKEYTIDPKDAFEKWVNLQIGQALADVYSRVGCAHEYDCCGCRSFAVRDVRCIARGEKDLWRVELYSSRNY